MNETNSVPGFHSTPGLMTDFRAAEPLLGGLATDVAGLCKVVQGWFMHVYWTQAHEYTPQERQASDIRLRDVESLVRVLNERDASPLTEPRDFTNRILTECRTHSVMLAALLIRAGIPARPRCGFAHYFWPPEKSKWEDHWVTEYWSSEEERWLLADAQLDETQRRCMGIAFDPCNLPRDGFLPATKVWTLCRDGELDPQLFNWDKFVGMTLIRWNLIRDAASLNKVEALGWDHWGGMFPLEDADLSAEELAFYDRVAELCSEDSDLPELRRLYRSDLRLRVPRTVQLMHLEEDGKYEIEYSDFLNGHAERLPLL